MSELARFQERFAAGIAADGPVPGICQARAFAVYRNTWRKALADALRDNYPVVAALVGQGTFQSLALAFIGGQAATSPVLAAFGEGFDRFLAVHPVGARLPYLADVARLERLRTEAHLSSDAVAIEPSRFWQRLEGGLDEGFELHPSARFAWFETPAPTIWQAHQDPGGFDSLALDRIGEGAFVVRRQGRVRVEKIGRAAYRLLSGIRAGQSVLQAAESAAETEAEEEIASALMLLATNEGLVDLAGEE